MNSRNICKILKCLNYGIFVYFSFNFNNFFFFGIFWKKYREKLLTHFCYLSSRSSDLLCWKLQLHFFDLYSNLVIEKTFEKIFLLIGFLKCNMKWVFIIVLLSLLGLLLWKAKHLTQAFSIPDFIIIRLLHRSHLNEA